MVTIAQGNARTTEWSWGFRDSGDASVEYHWDFREGKPAASTDVNSPKYDSTNGMNCAAGYTRFNGLDDTNIITEGTIFFEVQRSIIDWDNDTHASGFWVDSDGSTVATGSQYIVRIIENGASAREIFIFRNAASAGRMSIQVEGATDDTSQSMYPHEAYGLGRYTSLVTEVEDDWAIFALTWKNGRIYVMLDGQVTASFARDIIDGDIDTLHLGGFGANPFTGNMRRVQILNECIAPHISGPRQCIVGDSFVQRFTERTAPSTEAQADYESVQGALTYIAGEPPVTGTAVWYERANVAWMMTGAFSILQRLSVLKYGIMPPIYNAGRNGAQWRSDLGSQISAVQTAYVISVDPEILWCIGSVNDVDINDTTYDYLTDAQALIDTMAAGCRNLRKIYFVETFATPDSIRTDADDRTQWKAAWQTQRGEIAQMDGYVATNAKSEAVTVEFIPTWDAWATGGVVPGPYCIGTVPESDGPVSASANGDIHPTSAGMIRIGEILWPTFKNLIAGPP